MNAVERHRPDDTTLDALWPAPARRAMRERILATDLTVRPVSDPRRDLRAARAVFGALLAAGAAVALVAYLLAPAHPRSSAASPTTASDDSLQPGQFRHLVVRAQQAGGPGSDG